MIKPITQFFKLLYQALSGRDYDTGKKRETASEIIQDARFLTCINLTIIVLNLLYLAFRLGAIFSCKLS